MVRTVLLAGVFAVTAGCTATPLVTKSRMTLGEANIKDMECRRDPAPGSLVPKTVCANKDVWKVSDNRQAEESARFIDTARDGNDNRILYRQ